MARTTVLTTDNLRKQAWEEGLFRDTLVSSFFMSRFAMGGISNLEKGLTEGKLETTPNDILHVKTDLGAKGRTKTRNGDKMTFGLLPRIDPKVNAGVISGQTLKGKEVSLSTYNFSVELERYRQAVSGGGVMDWNRAAWDVPAESRASLEAWGRDKMELLCFQKLESAPSNIFYSADTAVPASTLKTSTLATAKTALVAAASKMTPKFLSFLKTWAKTGGGRAAAGQMPLRPVMVDGKPYYVVLTHPDAMYDWKMDSTYNQAMREAEVRGKDNPLFTGASFVWDGLIIHEHEYVTVGTDAGGGTVPWTYAHVLGAQALVVAFGERPSIVEDTEDYEEDLFYAWRMTMKVDKPVFNSKDYGSITSVVARTNVSGT
jgi:N4-gp56 family major capsid protein